MKELVEKRSDKEITRKLFEFAILEITNDFYTVAKFKEISSLLNTFSAAGSENLEQVHIFAKARFHIAKTTAIHQFMKAEEALKTEDPLYHYLMEGYQTESDALKYYDSEFCIFAYQNFKVLRTKYTEILPESDIFYNRLSAILLMFKQHDITVLSDNATQQKFHKEVSAVSIKSNPFYIGSFSTFHQIAIQAERFVKGNSDPFIFIQANPTACLKDGMERINNVIPPIVQLSKQIAGITAKTIERNKTTVKYLPNGMPNSQLTEYNNAVGMTLYNLHCILVRLHDISVIIRNVPNLPIAEKFKPVFSISTYATAMLGNMGEMLSNLCIMNQENPGIYQTVISPQNNSTPEIWEDYILATQRSWNALTVEVTRGTLTVHYNQIKQAEQNADELIAEEAEEIAKKQAELEAVRKAKIITLKLPKKVEELDNSNKQQEEEERQENSRQLDFPEASELYYKHKNMDAAIVSLKQAKTAGDVIKCIKADIFISECMMMKTTCKHLSANSKEKAEESLIISDRIREDFKAALKLQEKTNAKIKAELVKDIDASRREELALLKENLDIVQGFTKDLLAEKIAESQRIFEKLTAERERRKNSTNWKQDKAPDEVSPFTELFHKLKTVIPVLEHLQKPATHVERISQDTQARSR